MTTSEIPVTPKRWYELALGFPPGKQLLYYAGGMAREPAFHPWAECGMGVAYCHLKRFEDAIPHLVKATQLAPGLAHTWNNLGLAREALKDWAGAVAAFEKAAGLDPGLPVILNNLHEAQKGLVQEQERVRARATPLKRLHKYLLLAALVGTIFGIVSNYLLDYLQYFGDYFDFWSNYYWVMTILGIAQEACLIAGLVGLWLVTGRPRPWLLILGIACVVSPYFNLLFQGREYYPGGAFFCATQMLNLLFFGSYLATFAMGWRGKRFPKVAFGVQCVTAVFDAIVLYYFSCYSFLPGSWNTPFRTVAYAAMSILAILAPVTTQLRVAFWITTLQWPPLPAPRPEVSPARREQVLDYGGAKEQV